MTNRSENSEEDIDMTQTFYDWLARYRLHLSFFLFLALVLEWQMNDGGRPHALLDPRAPVPLLGLVLIAAWHDYAARTDICLPRFPARPVRGHWSWERWRHNREWRMWVGAGLMLALVEGVNAWTAGS